MSASEVQIYAENYSSGDAAASSALLAAAVPAGPAHEKSPSGSAVTVQAKSPTQPASAKPAQSGQIKQAAPGQKAPVQTASTMQDEGNFPPFDTNYFASHILWLAVCFGFFYFFMARVVLPRIGEVIETRRDRIAADLDQAARMKGEADAAVEAYRKSLNGARDQAKSIARMAAEEAKAKADAERKAVENELERKLAEAEKQVTAGRDKALAEVDNIARDIAADIVQRISGRKADKTALAQVVKAAGKTGSAA